VGDTTFMTAPRLYFTSESVTEGHPDKMCDQISDAVLDALLAADPRARVACECVTTTGLILVTGEITAAATIDIETIVRSVVREIGYTDSRFGFDGETCAVMISVKGQSKDIALGVDEAYEARCGECSETELAATGAGDQGMMIGFACAETPELMPAPIMLAHKLTKRLARVRKDGIVPYLRPDGKSQVTVEYEHGRPTRVDTVLVSTQHADDVEQRTIFDDVYAHVIQPVVPAAMLDERTNVYVNPTGRFVTGGPMGDAGLTGRKIIVDTYGGMARHGGGAFSGKDPTKVDRSAAYMCRYIAKNLVAAGLAERLELQVSYAIGVARPLSLMVETFGTGRIPDERIVELIQQHFDLRPAALIRALDLCRPIYRPTAAYGHFGRDDIDAPWERTDKAEVLRWDAG
jgi:S-adenosylmethionine synthetase